MLLTMLLDGMPVRRRWFHHYRRLARQAGIDVYNVNAGLWARPALVTRSSLPPVAPAEMKLAEHRRLLPTGAKTVGKGGSGASDKLSVVVAQSSWLTLFRSKDEN